MRRVVCVGKKCALILVQLQRLDIAADNDRNEKHIQTQRVDV
jgi:hypothetical protein